MYVILTILCCVCDNDENKTLKSKPFFPELELKRKEFNRTRNEIQNTKE